MSRHFISANGIRFHVAQAGKKGEKPLLLCLHGFPSTHHCWRHQLAAFEKDYFVVAPDMRGYNLTDKPKEGYDSATLCEDAHALMLALGYKKMTLVGHAWGGAIAWDYATRFPETLEKLVILNAPHPAVFAREVFSNPEQFKKSWYIFFFQLPLLPELYLSENRYGKALAAFKATAAPGSKGAFTDEDLEHYRSAFMQPGAMKCMVQYYRTAFQAMVKGLLKGQDPKKEAKVIHTPTLVIWGMQDNALGPGNLEGLEEYVSDLKIHRIEDAGHWVQEEKPEAVNVTMRAFLKGK